jgi:flagellar motor switch protein FliG
MDASAYTDQEEIGRLNGPQRAAALLLSMGRPLASRLLKHFDDVELRDVTRAATQLGAIPRASLEALVDEFADHFTAGLDLQSSVGEVEQLLTEALPAEQAAGILSDVFGGAISEVWEKVGVTVDSKLALYLEREHPQTSCYILAKLDSGYSAGVLSKMGRELRNEIIRRMISPQPTSEAALKIVEAALSADLLGNQQSGASDTRARVADIVNKLEPSEVEDVMQSIEQLQPKEAAALKKMLFSFEDLVKLSVRARSTLFDNISTDIVVLAFRGAAPEFRDAVLSSMASRARRLVESELNNGASPPQREIAKARRAIVEVVLKLAQRGEIELSPSDESEPS